MVLRMSDHERAVSSLQVDGRVMGFPKRGDPNIVPETPNKVPLIFGKSLVGGPDTCRVRP